MVPAAVLSSLETDMAMSVVELPRVAVDSMLVMLPVQLELSVRTGCDPWWCDPFWSELDKPTIGSWSESVKYRLPVELRLSEINTTKILKFASKNPGKGMPYTFGCVGVDAVGADAAVVPGQ